MKFLKKIFSIKNDNHHKVLTLFGMKLKLVNKYKKFIGQLCNLETRINYIENLFSNIPNQNHSSTLAMLQLIRIEKEIPQEKSILFVSHEFSLTGAPLILIPVINYLKKLGYYIAILSFKDGPLRNNFVKENIPTFVLNDIHENQALFLDLALKFSTIFCNTIDTYAAIDLLQGTNKEIIWWVHEGKCVEDLHIKIFKAQKNIRSLKDILKNCSGLYTVSNYSKSYLDKFCRNVKILKYGFEDSYKQQYINQTEKIVISMFGTIEERKGYDIIVKAIKTLPIEYKNRIELNIVGHDSQPFAQELKKQVSKDNNINWHGFVSFEEKDKIYKETDVVVCISRDDPEPKVVAEGMMFAKPCLVSTNVGQKDLITDNYNGFVVETENISKLCEKLIWIIENREQLPEIGLRSREIYLNNYKIEQFESQLEELFRQKSVCS